MATCGCRAGRRRARRWPVTVHEPTVTDEPLATTGADRRGDRHEHDEAADLVGSLAVVCHHLIDPDTGRPWARAARQVTVVAADGWWAEAAAKALIAPDSPLPPDCAAIVIDHAGHRHELGPIRDYLR